MNPVDLVLAIVSGLDPSTDAGSKAHVKLPDLRGVFLRGLNNFALGSNPRGDGLQDPEGPRQAGGFQMDVFKSHQHSYGTTISGFAKGSDGFGAIVRSDNNWQGYKNDNPILHTEDEGGSETRPKNAAVFYYIRVH
jgi:hypothetical protein